MPRNPTVKKSRTYGKPVPKSPNLRLEIAARQLPSIILAFPQASLDDAVKSALQYADALMRADRETAQ